MRHLRTATAFAKLRVEFRTAAPSCGCDTFAPVDDDMPPPPDPDTENTARWEGVLAVEGVPTGDGRMIEKGGLRWGPLPIPLRWAREDEGGHLGAVVVGWITDIRRNGSVIEAEGDFDLDSEEGREAARQVGKRLTTGVSVDLDDVDMEVRVAADLLEPETIEEGVEVPAPPDEQEDAEGRIVVMEINSDDELLVTKDARIRAATMVATPAFVEATLALVEAPKHDDDKVKAVGDDEEQDEALVASASRKPPAAWFSDPGLTAPTPFTVTDDGRVFGHLATWGTCHTGFPQECVTAPSSRADYAYFRTGLTVTEEGDEIATGRVTMDTLHAGRRLGASDTAAHYEHTGIAVADVAAGEDEHGIWVAGALRPSVTEDQIEVLRASPLSGDWRSIGGRLELVAALAVNSPGFPIPRALVASGRLRTLQGLSSPAPGVIGPVEGFGLSEDDLRALEKVARRERKEEEARRADVERARRRVLVAAAEAKVRGR